MINILKKSVVLFALITAINTTQAETIAVSAETIYTAGPLGTIKGGIILINDGVITSVGNSLRIPADAKVFYSKVVTPGLFDSTNTLGLTEVSAEEGTVDFNINDYDLNAAFDISLGLNMSSSLIAISRLGGITGSLATASNQDSIFQGQGALINLVENDYLINAPAPMFATLGESGARLAGGSRAAALSRLLQGLDEAFDFANEQNLYNKGHWPYHFSRKNLQALVPVINGQQPLVVSVNRASDIQLLLKQTSRYPSLKLVLSQADEAWKVADDIAKAGVPVIMNPLNNLPISFQSLGARLDAAAILHKSGVEIVFASFDTHNSRLLRQLAGNAVANGLAWEAALQAMTNVPAKVWGLSQQGQITPSYKANIVLWSGDPLEVTEYVEQVIINGKIQTNTSRQIQLKNRYRDLKNKKWPFAYQ